MHEHRYFIHDSKSSLWLRYLFVILTFVWKRNCPKIYFLKSLPYNHCSVAFGTPPFFSADGSRAKRLISKFGKPIATFIIPFRHQIHLGEHFHVVPYLHRRWPVSTSESFWHYIKLALPIGYSQSQSELCKGLNQPVSTVLSTILNSLFIKLTPFRQLYDKTKASQFRFWNIPWISL